MAKLRTARTARCVSTTRSGQPHRTRGRVRIDQGEGVCLHDAVGPEPATFDGVIAGLRAIATADEQSQALVGALGQGEVLHRPQPGCDEQFEHLVEIAGGIADQLVQARHQTCVGGQIDQHRDPWAAHRQRAAGRVTVGIAHL